MSVVVVLGVAVALAMDCFAVTLGLACGLKRLENRQAFRMAAFFGGFQFAMPVAGWLAGERLLGFIKGFDHWVAFGLLALVGGRMIYESLELSDEEETRRPDQTRGTRLVVLALATSIDALAVGLSLAALHVAIVFPAVVIGVVAFAMTVLGMKIGPALGKVIGRRAELLGGIVLILIGIKILVDHL